MRSTEKNERLEKVLIGVPLALMSIFSPNFG
jgi:hypothetical protein